jgi:hypothetical protein
MLIQIVLSVVPFVGNNFRRKKLLQVVPLKMDRFLTRKRDSEKLLKNRFILIIDFSSVYYF